MNYCSQVLFQLVDSTMDGQCYGLVPGFDHSFFWHMCCDLAAMWCLCLQYALSSNSFPLHSAGAIRRSLLECAQHNQLWKGPLFQYLYIFGKIWIALKNGLSGSSRAYSSDFCGDRIADLGLTVRRHVLTTRYPPRYVLFFTNFCIILL